MGKVARDGPENRELFAVGDRIMKINGIDLTGMRNADAIHRIKDTMQTALSITVTVLRTVSSSLELSLSQAGPNPVPSRAEMLAAALASEFDRKMIGFQQSSSC